MHRQLGRIGAVVLVCAMALAISPAHADQPLDASFIVDINEFDGRAIATISVNPDLDVLDVTLDSEHGGFEPLADRVPGTYFFDGDFGFGAGCFELTAEILIARTCQPIRPEPVFCQDDNKITELVLEYTGDPCSVMTHDQDGRMRCEGPGTGENNVSVMDEDGEEMLAKYEKERAEYEEKLAKLATENDPNKRAEETAKLEKEWAKKQAELAEKFAGVLVESGLDIGDIFTVSYGGEKFPSESHFTISSDTGEVLQQIAIHTSCSKSIDAGDQFGSLRIVEILSTTGELFEAPETNCPPTRLSLTTNTCKCANFPPG